MAKFNTIDRRRITTTGPIATVAAPGAVTHEGAPAFGRDTKSELFMLAVANMVGEDTFYESAKTRDDRYAGLVRTVALEDLDWLISFVRWLRGTANMRSASLVAAAEGVDARRKAGLGGEGRKLIDAALQRADEPGEFLAYWRSRFGRENMPVRKGLADAAQRLYTERAVLKYDTPTSAYRFADVLEIVHPKATSAWQNALFEHLLARRHNREMLFLNGTRERLAMLATRQHLAQMPEGNRRLILRDAPGLLGEAGMTWEALSAWLPGGMDKAAWEAIIPSMGVMALTRNLRNFEEAGISDEMAKYVADKISDPEVVAKSRMFPYRWLAAFEHAPGLRYSHALDKALGYSTAAIPEFTGRTLVVVDTSASMNSNGFSARSKMTPAKAAAIFGVALAHRNPGRVDLHGFADGVFAHPVKRGASLIQEVDRFMKRTGEVGHGTQIERSVQATYSGHDRVFIISDMQTMLDPGYSYTGERDSSATVPDNVPVYGVNLGGYAPTVIPAGQKRRRFEFGGLTDSMFQMVPLLEKGTSAGWPWE
jgi:hypothetical protein